MNKLELKMVLEQPELVTMADAASHFGQEKNHIAGILNKQKAGPHKIKHVGEYTGGTAFKYYKKEELYDYIDSYFERIKDVRKGKINRPDLMTVEEIVSKLGGKSSTPGALHFYFMQYRHYFKNVKIETIYPRKFYKRDQATAVIDAINKAKADHAKVCAHYKQRGKWKELVKIPKNEMQSLSFDFLTRRMK